MGKKILIGFIALMLCFAVFYSLIANGVITLATIGTDAETKKETFSVEDLEDGCYYVWHNGDSSIEVDLNGVVGIDAFKICPTGTINWSKNKNVPHTIWFDSENDIEIPTLYPGDELLYISSTSVPADGITWERFADYGYSIGVANMESDASGHYRIVLDIDDGYEGYLNFDSDAVQVADHTRVTALYLDKIGTIPVRDNMVSDGGTVIGLEKDGKYYCEWYTGTYYQDYEMKADNHVFCSMEEFITYEYEFLHSRAISITIPEWFKSGYYYIGGTGLFRYVAIEDLADYNGLAYDSNVNWNDPIILYDELNMVIYDPANGIDKRSENNSFFNTKRGTTTKQTTSSQSIIISADEYSQNTNAEDEYSDSGAEMYEDFYEEYYIE